MHAGDLTTTYGAWVVMDHCSGILGVFFGLLAKRIPIEQKELLGKKKSEHFLLVKRSSI